MLLMYNRTYAAEIGIFPCPLWSGVDFVSFCSGSKETLGDCGEGEKAWCCSNEWQCAVGEGRVECFLLYDRGGYYGIWHLSVERNFLPFTDNCFRTCNTSDFWMTVGTAQSPHPDHRRETGIEI